MTAQMVAAYILYYIGIVGFAAYVLISHVANNRIASYIFARDLEVYGKIVPCGIFWRPEVLGLALLALVVTGLAIERSEYIFIIFLVIVYVFLGVLMFKDSRKRLELDDDHIIIAEFRKEKQYLRSEICTIEWKNCRGITGRQLVIVFSDGSAYLFNMDHYRGVQNTYNELTS